MKKRTKIQIFSDILNYLDINKGRIKTHILYKANLSHMIMHQYIDELEDNKLIIKKDKLYFLSEEGIQLKNHIKMITNSIEKVQEYYNIEL